jgi:hypothetical protein
MMMMMMMVFNISDGRDDDLYIKMFTLQKVSLDTSDIKEMM